MVTCQIGHSLFNIPKKLQNKAADYLLDQWNNLYNNNNFPIEVIPEQEVAKSL